MMMVDALGRNLPDRFLAEPRVCRGPAIDGEGGTAAEITDLDGSEVLIHDIYRVRRLVAAVEIVSPANQDRLEHRRDFVAKCAGLFQARVCVAIVDVVTTRSANLNGELIEFLGGVDPCRPFPSGSPMTSPSRSTWMRVTRRPATSSGFLEPLVDPGREI